MFGKINFQIKCDVTTDEADARMESRGWRQHPKVVLSACLLAIVLNVSFPLDSGAEEFDGAWYCKPYALHYDGMSSVIGVRLPYYLYSTNAWLSSLSAETKASSEFQQSPECALYVLLTNYFPSVADVQFHEMATDGLRWHISATVLTNVSDAISIEKVGMTLIYTNGQYRPSEILDFSSPLAYALQLHPCRQGLFGDYFPQIITNGMAQVDLTNFGSNSLSIFIALGTNQYRTIDRVLEESPHFARLVQFAANNDVTNFSNQMFATNAYPDEPLVLSAVSNLMVAYQHPESIRLLGEIG